MIKPIFLTTGHNQAHPGWIKLKQSLEHWGWDYHFIEHPWVGLADRIYKLADYLREKNITYFVFGDAYDVLMLGTPEQFIKQNPLYNVTKLLYMGEKGCYPVWDYMDKYPKVYSPWCYVNGGCFAGYTRIFLNILDQNPIPANLNDQQWATENFLFRNQNRIQIDYNCEVFQSIAFEDKEDFALRQGRLINLVTVSAPIILHGNGQTPMDKFYALLP